MVEVGLRTNVKKINGDSLTPVLIFKRLGGTHKFLLESSTLHEGAGRYSFIGSNPRKSYIGKGHEVTETVLATQQTYTHTGDLFVLLKRLMPRVTNESVLPFSGGAVGYIASNPMQLTGLTDNELQLPDAHFNVYDTVIVYDHLLQEVSLIHTNIDPEVKKPDLDQLAQQLLHGESLENEGYTITPFESQISQQDFENLLSEAQGKIKENGVVQLVLSRRLEATFKGSAFEMYRLLRKREASPYLYYIECDDHTMIGASPASLVKVQGDEVKMSPISGTMIRGVNKQEDTLHEKNLLNNVVEVNAHKALVETCKKDLEHITVQNTVAVTEYLQPAHFPNVIHLISHLKGNLLPMLHGLDALAASLPSSAVTGVPKKEAALYVMELEKKHRSFYGGAVGYIGFNGNLDFALTIRSILLKDERAYTQVGVIVTGHSNISNEYDKSNLKLASLLRLSDVTAEGAML